MCKFNSAIAMKLVDFLAFPLFLIPIMKNIQYPVNNKTFGSIHTKQNIYLKLEKKKVIAFDDVIHLQIYIL